MGCERRDHRRALRRRDGRADARYGRGSCGEGIVGFGVASTLAGGIKGEDLRKQLADFERSIRSMRDSTSIDHPLSCIGLRDRSDQKGSDS